MERTASTSGGKIVVIGAGHVGSHCAYALMIQGVGREIVLLDIDREKAQSQAMDLSDGAHFAPHTMTVRAGDYTDCRDADLVILAAGAPRKPGSTRLDVMWDSMEIVRDVAPKLRDSGFAGVLITISNPADIIACEMQRLTGFPAHRVFSTGTGLDSSRLKKVLAGLLKVDRRSIQCCCMGEHGDSQMIPFSHIFVGMECLSTLAGSEPGRYGIDEAAVLERTRMIGMDIIEGKGSTEFGIGLVLADVARAVLHDEHRILPVSVQLNGEYGQDGIYAGVPAQLGREGVENIPQLSLTPSERGQFAASCAVIRRHIELVWKRESAE